MNTYIRWAATEEKIVDSEEIQAKIMELEAKGAAKPSTKSSAREWFSHDVSFSVDTSGKWTTLYIAEKSDFGHDCYRMSCNIYKKKEDVLEAEFISPGDCRKAIREKFKYFNRRRMCDAFGCVPASQFMNCVPKSTYYIDRYMSCRRINNVQYMDVSSMFPAMASGRMPDATRSIRIEGTAEPSEEYPFAFFLNSHHCAEFHVFDTREYKSLPREFKKWQCYTDSGKPIYNEVDPNDEITILMPASEYEFTEVFEYFYDRKLEGDPLAKAIMNKGIGTLHPNPKNRRNHRTDDLNAYYHVAAVIYGRANKKQYDAAARIKREGGIILQMIVDSIIYQLDRNLGKKYKKMGEYHNEFENVFYMSPGAINKYVLFDDKDELLKVCVSGVKNPTVIIPEDILNY